MPADQIGQRSLMRHGAKLHGAVDIDGINKRIFEVRVSRKILAKLLRVAFGRSQNLDPVFAPLHSV